MMYFNSKIGKKISFSYKTKALILLIPIGECVYGLQSWEERRSLCESMFIPIERQTLIIKYGAKWDFCYETKASIHLSQ